MATTLTPEIAAETLKTAMDRLQEIEQAVVGLRRALDILASGQAPADQSPRDIGQPGGGTTPIPH